MSSMLVRNCISSAINATVAVVAAAVGIVVVQCECGEGLFAEQILGPCIRLFYAWRRSHTDKIDRKR